LPEGAHEAVFSFIPASYCRGQIVSGGAVVLILVVTSVTWFRLRAAAI
jgi:hypothetical protein